MIDKLNKPISLLSNSFVLPWSIYPYANYQKYGLNNKIFSIFEINNKIFTKYDDSIQICFNLITDSECEEISNFVKINSIRMISAKQEVITKLQSFINNCDAHFGFIFEKDASNEINDPNVKHATTKTDFKEISKLVCECNSSNKSYYALEQFFHQIYSRYTEKYCRNWIFQINGNIVGHLATYAETNTYAIIGGLAVDEHYRRQGIGKKLLNSAFNELINENKTIYWFCYNPALIDFYKSISSNYYSYGKLMLKNNN